MGPPLFSFWNVISYISTISLVVYGRKHVYVANNAVCILIIFDNGDSILWERLVELKHIKKPWGYEIIWAQTDNYVGKLLHIKSGERLSKQYHEVKEETVIVLSGVLSVGDADDKITEVYPGETYHVVPGQVHRFGATYSNVELIEVSTNHLNDVVRLEDDYRRE